MNLLTSFLVIVGIASLTHGYKHFQSAIPNGDRVPHPCKPNYLWKGVGHKNEQGGGSRNPFGKDFEANGKKWDQNLCQKDSDGDGKTNGEELGDPDCTWTQNSIPKLTTGLSHPGVCEPLGDETCKAINTWEFCDEADFECPNIQREGAKNMTFNLPPTPVPNKETTYICKAFDVPTDTDYHLIATEPYIDNEYVMHHILVYGCHSDMMPIRKRFDEPAECGMGAQGCDLIGAWTLGSLGQCLDENVGYRFGNTSYKFILLQLHWNNPELRSDYTDSSGMTLHFTDNLRQYDAGTLTVGPTYLEIPPGATVHHEEQTCSSDCTKHVNGSIFFVSSTLHMHYLGKSGSLEHYRNGEKVQDIAVDEVFSYDSPVDHVHDNLEFKPGDELRMSCTYSSKSQTETTYYGDDTSAEMCFGFVTYYPATANFKTCVSYKSLDMCQITNPVGEIEDSFKAQGCDLEKFWPESNKIFMGMYYACSEMKCTETCHKYITNARKHKCLSGDVGEFLETIMSKDGESDAIQLLHICDGKNPTSSGERTNHQQPIVLMVVSIFAWIYLVQRN